ncbi:MAG: hypothetical protein PHX56_07705 [Atribacterota bacterium]|nr:hypothetical protein [Atribacterota bacterium]
MRTITFLVKLINYIKPQGLEDYKKRKKLPNRLRSIDSDNLNTYSKKVEQPLFQNVNSAWGKEIENLQNQTPWDIKKTPDFGDTLIGYIVIEQFEDFYREIYKPKKSKP